MLLAIAIVAAWGIPALEETHCEFLYVGIGKHVVGRSVVAMEGHGAKGLAGYLLMLPMFFGIVLINFLPWAVWLPKTVKDYWIRRRSLSPEEGYLALSVLLVFAVFTLVQTKLPHYILPAFPALAIVVARSLILAKDATTSRWLPRLGLGTAVFAISAGLIVCPMLVGMFPSRSLFLRAMPYLKPETVIGAYDYGEPSLIWEFRKKTTGFVEFPNDNKLTEFMHLKGARLLVLPTQQIPEKLPVLDPLWKLERIEGINLVKGKKVDLTLVIKPE